MHYHLHLPSVTFCLIYDCDDAMLAERRRSRLVLNALCLTRHGVTVTCRSSINPAAVRVRSVFLHHVGSLNRFTILE